MESVLLVGSSGVGKSQLVQALHGITEISQKKKDLYNLHLDTKYYTADVLLQVVDVQHQQSSHMEALILAFDANNRTSFMSVQKWCDRHDVEDIEVKLVVANKADLLQQAGTINRPDWLVDAVNWSFSNGFEYIETAAAHPNIDAQLELDGDQQGVARVLAALQAHMWPGLVHKQRTTSNSSHQLQKDQTVPAAGASTAAAADSGGQGPLQQSQQQHAQANTQGSSQAAAAGSGAVADPESLATNSSKDAPTQHQQQQQQQQPQQPSKQEMSGEKPLPADENDGLHLPDDLDLDDFDKLMQQVQGVRSRLSGLPDADRRAAAADMALKLAALMGLADSDEDDDGNHHDDGDAVEDQGIRGLHKSQRD